MPWLKSMRSFSAVAPTSCSEFVRTKLPSWSDTRGRLPRALQRRRSLVVPSAPAASTTALARSVRGRGTSQEVERTVSTSNPPPGSGRRSVTSVSGWIVAPRRSARKR